MWQVWMARFFNLQKNDLVAQNVRLAEIVAMWDSVKDGG